MTLTCSSPLTCKASHVIMDGNQVGQQWFIFGKIHLDCSQSPPSCGQKRVSKGFIPLSFQGLKRDWLSCHSPGWPFASFCNGCNVILSPVIRVLSELHDLSKMVRKGFAKTSDISFSTMDTTCLSPWAGTGQVLRSNPWSSLLHLLVSIFSLKFLTKQRPGKPCLGRLSQIKHRGPGSSIY